MYRDYSWIDEYLCRLEDDVYSQPADEGHVIWASNAINFLLKKIPDIWNVLDVGCGSGFCAPMFKKLGIKWRGISMSWEDCEEASMNYGDVFYGDFTFMHGIRSGEFDLVFARHALEHSPMPVITLMEWHRVSAKYLAIIAPAPDYWTYRGRNHYSVMAKEQLLWLLEIAGWKVIKESELLSTDDIFLDVYIEQNMKVHGKPYIPKDTFPIEYWILCEKEESDEILQNL